MHSTRQHALFALWVAAWTASCAMTVLLAARQVPFEMRAAFCLEGLAVCLTMPLAALLGAILVRLASAEPRGDRSRELDHLLAVKRGAGRRWRSTPGAKVKPIGLSAAVPRVAAEQPAENAELLDSLVALKRRRGWFPQGIRLPDDDPPLS